MLVGLRGHIPDVLSFYIAQVFFAIGFSFRSLSLRLEISTKRFAFCLILQHAAQHPGCFFMNLQALCQ